MTVTEALMGGGAFTVALRSDTPWEIRSQLDVWGHVVVTPGRVPFPTVDVDDLRGLSQFTGFVDRIEGDMTVLVGRGLGALVGDGLRGRRMEGDPAGGYGLGLHDQLTFGWGPGNNIDRLLTDSSGAEPFDLFPRTGDGNNGIRGGAISTAGFATLPGMVTGGTLRVLADYISSNQLPTARILLDWMTENLSPMPTMEWRFNPDCTIDFDLAANLFRDREVLLSEDFGDAVGGLVGGGAVRCVQVSESQIVSIDGTVMTTEWRVRSRNSNWDPANAGATAPAWRVGSSASGTTRYSMRGGQIEMVGWTETGYDDASVADLDTVAADTQGLYDEATKTIALTVRGRDVRSLAECGDTVLVFDPYRNLTGNDGVNVGGAILNADAQRVWEMEWPVTDAHGVYFVIPTLSGTGENRVLDLSPYVAGDDDATLVTVGNRPRTMNELTDGLTPWWRA